jgi:DNA-nicking Smr family endonuclease
MAILTVNRELPSRIRRGYDAITQFRLQALTNTSGVAGVRRPRRIPKVTKPPPNADDIALFRDSVKEVKRLRQDRAPPFRRRTKPIPRQTIADQARVRQEMISLDYDPGEVQTGDEMYFMRPGVQRGLMSRLRRGQFAIAAELDLHGMTVVLAREALSDFLADCQVSGARCVRIIHGKGRSSPGRKPVLKSKLNLWLQHTDDVLAFCSARPFDGGTGAVYVLLKRRS